MIQFSLDDKVEAALQKRAAAVGKDLQTYVAELLTRVSQPIQPLHEISGPLMNEFAASGFDEQSLAKELERLKHDGRRDQKAQG